MTPCLLNFLEGHSRAEQPYMRQIADLLLIYKKWYIKLIVIPSISCMHLASCRELIAQGRGG